MVHCALCRCYFECWSKRRSWFCLGSMHTFQDRVFSPRRMWVHIGILEHTAYLKYYLLPVTSRSVWCWLHWESLWSWRAGEVNHVKNLYIVSFQLKFWTQSFDFEGYPLISHHVMDICMILENPRSLWQRGCLLLNYAGFSLTALSAEVMAMVHVLCHNTIGIDSHIIHQTSSNTIQSLHL